MRTAEGTGCQNARIEGKATRNEKWNRRKNERKGNNDLVCSKAQIRQTCHSPPPSLSALSEAGNDVAAALLV